MDPISLTLLTAALSAGSGGLVSVIKKGVQAFQAERKFVKETSQNQQELSVTHHAGVGPKEPKSEGTMREHITSLVRMANLSEAEKRLLLDGLEQSSQDGQQRYAQKLYEELQAAR